MLSERKDQKLAESPPPSLSYDRYHAISRNQALKTYTTLTPNHTSPNESLPFYEPVSDLSSAHYATPRFTTRDTVSSYWSGHDHDAHQNFGKMHATHKSHYIHKQKSIHSNKMSPMRNDHIVKTSDRGLLSEFGAELRPTSESHTIMKPIGMEGLDALASASCITLSPQEEDYIILAGNQKPCDNPPTPIMHSSNRNTAFNKRKYWACDVCKEMSFESYDEAIAHENECAGISSEKALSSYFSLSPQDEDKTYYQHVDLKRARETPSTNSNGFCGPHGQNASTSPKYENTDVNTSCEYQTIVYKRQRLNETQIITKLHSPSQHESKSYSLEPSQYCKEVQNSTPILVADNEGPLKGNPHDERFADGLASMLLALPEDRQHLTDLHCFVRTFCVEVFCATDVEVHAPRRGRKKKVVSGQIGIRCIHCKYDAAKRKGAAFYPSSIRGIYNATMIIQQRHFNECPSVPADIQSQYTILRSVVARSGTAKKYWETSARKLGLIDTESGIRISLLNDQEPEETTKPASCGQSPDTVACILVEPSDKRFTTDYAYTLMMQLTRCRFTESDRLGKRKGHQVGSPGMSCKYCFGSNGSGRYFPSSMKTFADVSKTLNVLHAHLEKCASCPDDVVAHLQTLKERHPKEKAGKAFGAQKIFFELVWNRLHQNDSNQNGSPDRSNSERKENNVPTRGNHDASNHSLTERGGFHLLNVSTSNHLTVGDVAQVLANDLCTTPVIWKEGSSPESSSSTHETVAV